MITERTSSCRTVTMLAAMLLLGTGAVHAQRRPAMLGGGLSFQPPPAFGVRVGYDFDADVWSLGGQIRVPSPLPLPPSLMLVPSGDLFLSDDGSDWQLNLDGTISVDRMVYAGSGMAVVRKDFSGDGTATTEIGYNLFAGLQLPPLRLPLLPFIEARWTYVQGLHPFRLVAGVNLLLGRTPRIPRPGVR